jgi:hypothetical protein
MANLAHTWQRQGYIDKALLLLLDCAELQKKKLGAEHPDTKRTLETANSWQAN